MENIRRIAIIGAGAMGAAYAAMFSRSKGFDVVFVAEGERYQRLNGARLRVNDEEIRIPAVRPTDRGGPADLVLVALKHHHLAHALESIQSLVGDQTVVLSVMNGLVSERIIGAVCGMDKLVYAIAVGIDAVREDNRFRYSNPGKILFGAGPDAGDGRRVRRLQEALNRAGIPNQVPEDVLRALWWKFMVNVGTNQASAVLGAPYGVFRTSSEARALMRSLMAEVIALAPEAGVDLTEKDIDEWEGILATLSPTGKTSMLQDIEARRKTEVEIFAGEVVSLGKRHGVPTPVNQTVLRILRVMEGKGAGS